MPARLFVSLPPDYSLAPPNQVEFFFFFFFPFQLEPLQDNGASLTCTQATPLPPSLTPCGTHAPVLCAFHSRFACTLPAAAPSTWLHYLDGFFLFSSFYIFNSNRRRTMAATTSPSPPRTRRRPRSLAPTHPQGAQAPAAAKTVTAPTPSPECPPPALVASPMPPQPPLPRLSHCNATAGVIVRRASGVLGLRRVKPYQGFSSVMHKYQVEPRSRQVYVEMLSRLL